MTNEELAVMIQGGQADLVPTLWEQVERFVAKQAHRWFLNNRRRVEFDDLYQSGFLAMMEAVRTFDPEGGSSFLSWMPLWQLWAPGQKNSVKTRCTLPQV